MPASYCGRGWSKIDASAIAIVVRKIEDADGEH
jgi:hypothetical protein